MTQPTGVFVRLPLDEAQIMKLYNPKKSGNENLLAIGTPVTGGDTSVVDYSEYEPKYHDQGMGCGLEDRGIHDRYEAMGYGWDQAMERVCSELPETVLLTDYQAAIAALEAEVGRLWEYYEANEDIKRTGLFGATAEMFDRESLAREALKGPEA